MPQRSRRLSLNRETIRELARTDLTQAAGGAIVTEDQCDSIDANLTCPGGKCSLGPGLCYARPATYIVVDGLCVINTGAFCAANTIRCYTDLPC